MLNDTLHDKIKNSLLHIAKTLANKKEEINNQLEENLKYRLEKNDFDEDKYINSLKSNVILYKVIIRNRELLLMKWIESGNIPEKSIRDLELKKIVSKSNIYVENGIKSGGKTFNERDLKSISVYEDMEKSQLRVKLESEYKYLNVYKDIFNIFINELSVVGVEDFSSMEIKEIFKIMKLELSKATNFIVKSLNNKENENKSVNLIKEKTREETTTVNNIDNEENINEDETVTKNSKWKKVMIACCALVVCTIIGVGGVVANGILKNKENTEETPQLVTDGGDYEEVTPQEEISSYSEEDEEVVEESVGNINPENENVNYEYVDYDEAEEYYSVYTEAYNDRAYAMDYAKTLDKKNIDSTIIEEDGVYKVRIGSTYDLELAEKIAKEVKVKSVNTYILAYSTYYDNKVVELEDLAMYDYIDEFKYEYRKLKNELADKKTFGRYTKIIDELYEKYMQ